MTEASLEEELHEALEEVNLKIVEAQAERARLNIVQEELTMRRIAIVRQLGELSTMKESE